MSACSDPKCGIQDGLTCHKGWTNLSDCPSFVKVPSDETKSEEGNLVAPEGRRLPWSGRALGTEDMTMVAARSPTSLIGLIGVRDAGKTAFLSSLFSHFSTVGTLAGHAFSGSLTLGGWDELRKPTEWPNVSGPSFPPHTPMRGGRIPSLLHLSFRRLNDCLRDVLFTDAPGEWFSNWIMTQSSQAAEGARWIAEHSSHFLFFVDRKALAEEGGAKARGQIIQLARLLAENCGNRQIIVVWSKSDFENRNIENEAFVRERLSLHFGEHPSFELAKNTNTCLRVLEMILTPQRCVTTIQNSPVVDEKSLFLAYGRDKERRLL